MGSAQTDMRLLWPWSCRAACELTQRKKWQEGEILYTKQHVAREDDGSRVFAGAWKRMKGSWLQWRGEAMQQNQSLDRGLASEVETK